jgi:hypothetical protein
MAGQLLRQAPSPVRRGSVGDLVGVPSASPGPFAAIRRDALYVRNFEDMAVILGECSMIAERHPAVAETKGQITRFRCGFLTPIRAEDVRTGPLNRAVGWRLHRVAAPSTIHPADRTNLIRVGSASS